MNKYFLLDYKTCATFNGSVSFQTVYKLIKHSITNYSSDVFETPITLDSLIVVMAVNRDEHLLNRRICPHPSLFVHVIM